MQMLGKGFSNDTSRQDDSVFYLAAIGDNTGLITANPVEVTITFS
jgi:hypothetical protein